MLDFKNKKISFFIILFSILMIVFGLLTKYYPKFSNKKNIPLSYYRVKVFNFDFVYINFLFFFIITLGLGVYLFYFSNDD